MGVRSCFRYVGIAVPVVSVVLAGMVLSPAAAPPASALGGGEGWATAVPAPCTTPCSFTADNDGTGLVAFPVGGSANEHTSWFLVEAPDTTAYTVRAETTGDPWHATLVIADLDGTVLANDDDPAGRDPAATVLLGAGWYAVGLGGHGATDRGTATITVAMGTPEVPLDVVAEAGEQSLQVRWTAPDDHGDAITEYHVYLDGGTTAVVVPGTDTAATIPDVTVGQSYTAQVTAVNAQGETARSAASLAAVPYSSTTTTIAFDPVTVVWPATFTVTATVTAPVPVTSGVVSFSRNGTRVADVTVEDGTAALSGQALNPSAYTFTASYKGSEYLKASNASKSITVAKAAQTITFDPVADTAINAGPVTVTATSSSALTVSVVPLTPSVCTVRTRTVTLLTTGTCTLSATQTGNSFYAAAPTVTRSFAVVPDPTTTTSSTTTTTEPPTTTSSSTTTTTTSTTTTTTEPPTTTSSSTTTTTTEPPTTTSSSTTTTTTEPPTTTSSTTTTTSSTSSTTTEPPTSAPTTTEPVTDTGTTTTSTTSTTTTTTIPVTEPGTSSSSSTSTTSPTSTTSSTTPPASTTTAAPTTAAPTTTTVAVAPAFTAFAPATLAGPSVLTAGRTVAITVLGTRDVPATGVAAVAVVLSVGNAGVTGKVSVAACTATDGPAAVLSAGRATRLTALVPLGSGDARVCVRSTATITYRLEITGWAASGGSYHAAPSTPLLWSGTLAAGATRRVPVAGRAGVPSGARGLVVTLHLTAAGTAQAGTVTAGACGARGTVVLHVPAGAAAANLAVVPVDAASGSICVTSGSARSLRMSLEGWTAGGAFHAATARLVDGGRSGALATGRTLKVELPVAARGTATAASLVVATSGATGAGTVRIGACGIAPSLAPVNAGAATSTATVVAVRPGTALCISTTRRAVVTVDLTGWFDGAA